MIMKEKSDWDMFGPVSQTLPHQWLSFLFSLAFLFESLLASVRGKPHWNLSICVPQRFHTQVCRWLRLFWVTHCSLCWTVEDRAEKNLEILVDMVPFFTIIDQLGETNNDCKELKGLVVQYSLQIISNSNDTCL